MPLIKVIENDPNMKKVRVKEKFERLPPKDKVGVLKFVKEGSEDIEFSEAGKQFVAEPDFKEMFEHHKKTPEPSIRPELKSILPMLSGLMQIIKSGVGDPDEKREGRLKPEFAERMGGSQKIGNPFESKFEDAFKTEGARGIARLHKSLLTDPEYDEFLSGV